MRDHGRRTHSRPVTARLGEFSFPTHRARPLSLQTYVGYGCVLRHPVCAPCISPWPEIDHEV